MNESALEACRWLLKKGHRIIDAALVAADFLAGR